MKICSVRAEFHVDTERRPTGRTDG